jgi:hypothetical protein
MIARGGTWDTNLKVVARKTPRRAMPVPYKSSGRTQNPGGYLAELIASAIAWCSAEGNNALAMVFALSI